MDFFEQALANIAHLDNEIELMTEDLHNYPVRDMSLDNYFAEAMYQE